MYRHSNVTIALRLFLFSLLSEQGRIDTNPGMKERIVPQKRSNKTPTTKARPTKRNGRAAKSAHAPGSTSSFTRVRPTTRKRRGVFSSSTGTRQLTPNPKGVSLPRCCSLAVTCSSEPELLAALQQWEESAVQLRAPSQPIRRSRAFGSKMPLPSWLISPSYPMTTTGGFRHPRTCLSAVLFGDTITPSQPACARPRLTSTQHHPSLLF